MRRVLSTPRCFPGRRRFAGAQTAPRLRCPGPSAAAGTRAGFSLLEALVALVLIATFFFGVLAMWIAGDYVVLNARLESQANRYLRLYQDLVTYLPYDQIPRFADLLSRETTVPLDPEPDLAQPLPGGGPPSAAARLLTIVVAVNGMNVGTPDEYYTLEITGSYPLNVALPGQSPDAENAPPTRRAIHFPPVRRSRY